MQGSTVEHGWHWLNLSSSRATSEADIASSLSWSGTSVATTFHQINEFSHWDFQCFAKSYWCFKFHQFHPTFLFLWQIPLELIFSKEVHFSRNLPMGSPWITLAPSRSATADGKARPAPTWRISQQLTRCKWANHCPHHRTQHRSNGNSIKVTSTTNDSFSGLKRYG